MSEQSENNDDEKKPSITQVMASVMSAFFGVQSSKNKERDFKHGNHRVFIIMGLVTTALFIGGIALLVQFVLHITKAG
ncbi:DUF2970 domain-containing protein [Dasania marina]|uniref:DUF2970 domain-containing protein n=1 Tax=Dasania marina TaxID=471499 RepID=UPI0030DCAEC8|tara:strand:- start:1934 stop:2167 length:234 start_codon:yes stop_codon:yes gene_type:complete